MGHGSRTTPPLPTRPCPLNWGFGPAPTASALLRNQQTFSGVDHGASEMNEQIGHATICQRSPGPLELVESGDGGGWSAFLSGPPFVSVRQAPGRLAVAHIHPVPPCWLPCGAGSRSEATGGESRPSRQNRPSRPGSGKIGPQQPAISFLASALETSTAHLSAATRVNELLAPGSLAPSSARAWSKIWAGPDATRPPGISC